MKSRLPGKAALLCAAWVVLFTGACGPARPVAYVYVSNDGDPEIYVMGADGNGRKQVTRNDGILDNAPSWAPDGTSFAFNSTPLGGAADIYIAITDGSGVTRLTQEPADEEFADWSTDGTRILFTSQVLGGLRLYSPAAGGGPGSTIMVMNRDGSGRRALTDDVATRVARDWSPDGTKILYAQRMPSPARIPPPPPDIDIFVMDADGSNAINLTNDPAIDDIPRWSPDGTRILFRSDREGAPNIYLMNADGSGLVRLTEEVDGTQEAEWSPDGSSIAFASAGDWALWVINADGSGLMRLADGGSSPEWCDGGARIVFQVQNGANSAGFSVRPDGSELTPLGGGDLEHPMFSPRCRPAVTQTD